MIVAVLDACVLYPPSLRDLLMRVGVVGAYEPRFTEMIHTEWIRNVLADNPNLNCGVGVSSAGSLDQSGESWCPAAIVWVQPGVHPGQNETSPRQYSSPIQALRIRKICVAR